MRIMQPLNLQVGLTAVVGTAFLVTTLSLSQAQSPRSQPTRPSEPTRRTDVSRHVLRESSVLLDRPGAVVRRQARLAFVSEDGRLTMTLLECSMLGRVEKLLELSGESLRLLVSGTVTEYRNRNYLLLSRVYVDPGSAATGS